MVGPKLVRPTVPYEVLVTSYDLKESTFLISIDGNSSSRTPFDRSETITLEGTDSKKLKFDVSTEKLYNKFDSVAKFAKLFYSCTTFHQAIIS